MQLTHTVPELQSGSTGKRVTMSCELSAVIAAGIEICKPIETNGKIRNWFVFRKKKKKQKNKITPKTNKKTPYVGFFVDSS